MQASIGGYVYFFHYIKWCYTDLGPSSLKSCLSEKERTQISLALWWGYIPIKSLPVENKISQKFKFYLHHNSASPTFNTPWTFTSATVGQNHLPKAYYIMVLNISCDVSTIVLYMKDGLIYVYRPVVSILTVIILLTGSWGHTATALFMKDHYSAYH